MLKWGVIGAGGFADRRVIPQIKEARGCVLEAVMVRDRKKAERLAEKHGARKSYNSVDGLLQDPDVDAVYICTPVYLHRKHTLKAVEAGKHVLCEKPMALNVEECEKMIKASQEAGVKLMVGFMMRFHPAHQKAKELIEKGVLGDIVLAHIQNLLWYPPAEGAWRQNPKLGGGGVLMDVGSHCIDLLCFLLGRVKEVAGIAKSVIFNYPVEDTSTFILKFTRGTRGVVENSFAIPYRENHLEIYGTRGTLLISRSIGPFKDFQMKLITEEGEKLLPLSYEDPYRREFEEFVKAVEEDRLPPIPGETGRENIKIIESAYLSSKKEGKFIPVPG